MEFNEKLQKLRMREGLTQEELAQKLHVSRTAVSKWESGRGYPSIDSLKAVARYFHVTIDEMICGEEIVTLAEQEKKASGKQYTALICGILDCLLAFLFFLPVFGCGGTGSGALLSVTGIRPWIRTVFLVLVSLSVINGFCTVVISNFDRPVWNRYCLVTGLVLSVAGTMVFILTRQPYAGLFSLSIFVIKGILMWKNK